MTPVNRFMLVFTLALIAASIVAGIIKVVYHFFEVQIKVFIGRHRKVVMRGYKGFTKPLACRDFQFKVGEVFAVKGEPMLCENGFHFCRKLSHVFHFYDCDFSKPESWQENVYCEIEALGRIEQVDRKFFCLFPPKCCTDIIRIKRIIPWEEVKQIYQREQGYVHSHRLSNSQKEKNKKQAKKARRKR